MYAYTYISYQDHLFSKYALTIMVTKPFHCFIVDSSTGDLGTKDKKN